MKRGITAEYWDDGSYGYEVDVVEFPETEESPEDVGLGMADQWAPI